MAMNTTNNSHFIEAQQYSQFILENLQDGLLPEAVYRNVSDFPAGTTLNIKTVGSTTIQEVAEDTPITYNPIDTGNVTLAMTDYVGDAWYITDVLRQDGSQIDTLHSMRGMESTRAIQEYFETRMFAAANASQTAGNLNLINGRPHRFVADAAADNTYKMSVDYFIAMKLAFDKANVPVGGRIAIVDPLVEATLNKLTTLTATSLDRNPRFQSILENGFATEHTFMFNLFGFDVWTSNRLPAITATEAIDASTYGIGAAETAPIGSKANLFMCVADDACKPMMAAWRQQPSVESERNKDRGRDEFVTRARWGVGAQRVDTLGVILTSASNW